MDRLRDATRRGNVTAGGQTSSLRRPRSSGGFKDPGDEDEAMEDLHGGRLRERPRKESTMHSGSRSKRTRHSARELHARVEDIEGTERGEGYPIDEDDLPISPNLLPRKHTKLKFHGKGASDGAAMVEIPAVPRKARTAISKRLHESNYGDPPRHQVCPSVPRLPSAVVAPPTLSDASLKPVKRMKHSSSKVKSTKISKAPESATISQQEVEVAEVLFDLARMVSNLGSLEGNTENMEAKTENSEMRGAVRRSSPECLLLQRQDSVSTPQTSHSAVSSPVRGPLPVMSSHLSSTDGSANRLSLFKMKVEDGAVSQLNEDTSPSVVDHKSAGDSCPGQSVGSNAPAEVKLSSSLTTGQGSQPKAFLSPPILALPSQSSVVADNNYAVVEAKSSSSPKIPISNSIALEQHLSEASLSKECFEQKQHGLGCSPQEACDTSALVKENTLKSSQSGKYGIDLMASPNASAGGESEKEGKGVDPGLLSSKQTQNLDKDLSHVDPNNLKQVCMEVPVKEEKSLVGMEEDIRVCTVSKSEHGEGGMLRGSEREDLLVRVPKQEASDSVLSSKAKLTSQRSVTGSGWLGSNPRLGYYPAAAARAAAAAAVAAAWPAAGSVIGPLSVAEKSQAGSVVPPSAFPGARPLYKRCAMHVYIAHLIDTQQQMQRHPLWAAAHGNCANGSPYTLSSNAFNAPCFPSNTLFGGALTGQTGLTISNPQANEGAGLESYLQNDKSSMPAVEEIVTAQNVDGCDRKGGLGSSSGYSPVSQSTTSLEIGARNKGNAGGMQSSPLGSCSELAGVSTGVTSNAESGNPATAQVQYLPAMIQQAGFPFLFSSGHMMPSVQGHQLQQQPTPLFDSHLYNLPFIQFQQNPATAKGMPKASTHQGHSSSLNGDTYVGQAVSQPQHRQQFSSASSSHSQQRNAPQHLQHVGDIEMNLGGETVSSAESNFPGYQKTMDVHQICDNMQVSNIVSSSSLNSASQSVILPAHVALSANQMTTTKFSQVQFQKHLPNITPYQGSGGGKVFDFQTALTAKDMQMGTSSNNMVGPGPLGFASVAAVMAPQGHAMLQTMSDSQLSLPFTYQEIHNKAASSLVLDGSRVASVLGMPDDERLPSFKQDGLARMDKGNEGGCVGSLGYSSGLSPTTVSETSFSFMNGAMANSGSRQVTSVAVGSSFPSLGELLNPNANVTVCEASNSAPSPSLLFHAPKVAQNQGWREGQAACQYSLQSKPPSYLHIGTTGVATPPSNLFAGSHATVAPLAKQQSYPSKIHQASVNSVQTRFHPITASPSSNLVSPSTAISKAALRAAAKNLPVGKSSLNALPKQNSAIPAKRPDMIVAHLPGQVMGPSSMTISMGQGPPQHQQAQQQQMQHIMRQQQQQQYHWPQQQKHPLHQEHRQPSPQNAQQFHMMGLPSGVSLQYHQAQASNQSLQVGVQNPSISPQQAKQHPYLEQHLCQALHPQPLSTESQRSTRIDIQPQQQSGQQNVPFNTNRSTQQPSEVQPNRQQTVSSHYQSVPLGRLGTSVAAQNSFFSVGSFGERPASLDGNLGQVSSPKAVPGIKSIGGTNVVVSAPSIQRTSSSSMGISYFQGVGTKISERMPPQLISTMSYLPYLQSATYSGGMAQEAKFHGAFGVDAQSGVSMGMREGSVGSGHENSTLYQHDHDKSSPASKISDMSNHSAWNMSNLSACTTTVKSLSSLPISACTAPLASGCSLTPGQISQTCTVTSVTMAADSVSTTG